MEPTIEQRVRVICLALPEVTERPSHDTPAFFVRGRKAIAYLWPDGHHDAAFAQLWCAAPPGAQGELLAADPARFFRPPYVGHRGWLGVRLDRYPDWSEVAELCEDAFRTVASKTLVARLSSPRRRPR
ncbi:MmcQ/YjbR family DNA-binding protein [Actinoplanes sp. NBRC 101535]|uniref:MmcQ/YjbR family DNA-binding protein n=1 Tax=Actinoplanes sp. NBRC 101535 TaxID=3032196 RepID=UPI0024A557FC|nr:MmcQ/YjbR family DNA-binding protein [Actinoplanes sp. NBRC 101535]GLY00054.1 phosphoribosylglycinamide formyltransferase [Actinoplanes sp. NBRC 101535]